MNDFLRLRFAHSLFSRSYSSTPRTEQDCLVPHGYEPDPSFAEWIHRQRTTYAAMLKDENPSPLVQERMKKLQELGFNFTVHTDKWMEHYEQLKQYKEAHGDCK